MTTKNILMALLKAKYLEIFAQDLEQEEIETILELRRLQGAMGLDVFPQEGYQPVLIWESKCGQTVACLMTPEGVDLNQPMCCTQGQITVKVSDRVEVGSEKWEALEAEIELLQKLFE